MNKNDEMNNESEILQIRSLGHSGEGVGALNGYTVFIDGALPGEEVSFRYTQKKKSYGKGELLSILSPSSERISPPCPLYSRCGGCQLMHLSYEGQLQVKRQKVIDALQRIAKVDHSVASCVPSPNPLHYRNKIQTPVQIIGGNVNIGLYAKHSHTLIDVPSCQIHCEMGEMIYQKLRALLSGSDIDQELCHLIIKSAVFKNEALVILVTKKAPTPSLRQLAHEILSLCKNVKGVIHNRQKENSNVVLGRQFETLAGEETIEENLLGLRFRISAASFFQVNSPQAEALYQKVLSLAKIQKTDKVLDAFCGVGTLSLLAAREALEVVGIECIPEAVNNAKNNAKLNALNNALFFCAETEKWLTDNKKFDVVFLNPPRQGCALPVLEALKKCRPHTIIYISCDPATLARDIKELLNDEYDLDGVYPFDMFPQTAHVETIVKLVRKVAS